MQFLDLTLPSPAENLALDEALLLAADGPVIPNSTNPEVKHERAEFAPPTDRLDSEVLRIWRPTNPFIVLGRSSHYCQEIHVQQASQRSIPVVRRFSGGATVVVGSGCLLYSLLIRLDSAPGLRLLDVAHRFVMHRMLEAILRIEPTVCFRGTCDLTLLGRKFSGNSLRVGRNWMLYHGTLLLDMQLSLVDELLKHPPREPDYRKGRSHADFLTNLPIDESALVEAIRGVWQAEQALANIPLSFVPMLVQQKYGRDEWNLQR